MRSSLRSTLACAVAFGLAAVSASFVGCAQEGTTPTCENNVSSDGILINKTKTPCESFGRCYVDGKQHPAKDCCVDKNGDPLGGSSLTQCLYGFGEVDLDSTGGAGGTGGTTATGGAGGTTGP